MTEKNEKDSQDPKEHLKLQGYNALIQYGCQMSADHLNYDRILMPISLAPPLLVLIPSNERNISQWAESCILAGGVLLLAFWVFRNIRSRARLYNVWETVISIEKDLGFPAVKKVLDATNKLWVPRDFTLKFIFAGLAAVFYVFVFYHVWCT